MKSVADLVALGLLLGTWSCINPFAPKLDTSPAQPLCDPLTPEGVFQCMQVAYTFRDTTVYAPLLDESFVFIWRDYDNGGIDVTWGRDTELRTTYGLFQDTQKLDLIWNNILSRNDSGQVRTSIVRGFNLTVTFNPSDIIRIDGYANITMSRPNTSSPWKIIRWRDESNF